MHRLRAALLALLVAPLALFARPAVATPPQPPLQLVVRLVEAPAPGRPVRFTIDVTPLVAVENVSVRVVPPPGVELVAGPAREVARDVARGRTRRFERTLRVPPGRRHHVHVLVEATTSSGHVWTRGEPLVVLAGPLAVPDPPRRVVPDGRGGSLVEFDGATR